MNEDDVEEEHSAQSRAIPRQGELVSMKRKVVSDFRGTTMYLLSA